VVRLAAVILITVLACAPAVILVPLSPGIVVPASAVVATEIVRADVAHQFATETER
jgi:hypothetical protein